MAAPQRPLLIDDMQIGLAPMTLQDFTRSINGIAIYNDDLLGN